MVDAKLLSRRLAGHLEAARRHDGAAVIKSDAYYGGQLGELGGERREGLIERCRIKGCDAEFGAWLGGATLRIWQRRGRR